MLLCNGGMYKKSGSKTETLSSKAAPFIMRSAQFLWRFFVKSTEMQFFSDFLLHLPIIVV